MYRRVISDIEDETFSIIKDDQNEPNGFKLIACGLYLPQTTTLLKELNHNPVIELMKKLTELYPGIDERSMPNICYRVEPRVSDEGDVTTIDIEVFIDGRWWTVYCTENDLYSPDDVLFYLKHTVEPHIATLNKKVNLFAPTISSVVAADATRTHTDNPIQHHQV